MKFTKYALMAAGCAMFAACSSDDPEAPQGTQTGDAATTAAGYVAVEIKLPQVAGIGSKATNGTPTYDDGDAQEYAVVNGTVIVFKNAATEADAEVVCTAPLVGMSFGPAQGNQNITTSSTAVAQLSNVSVTNADTYSAVVVLNSDEKFPMPAIGTKFGAWSTTASNCTMQMDVNGKKYLTMTNAALLNGTTPVVLTPIDKTKITANEAEAIKAGTAATFHVQRAVAKVATKFAANYVPTGSEYGQDKVQILGWMCDITNKTTYPVQVTEGLAADFSAIWSTDRFKGEGTPTRVYWGKDPNYSGISETDATTAFNHYTAADLDNAGNPAAIYPLENTFALTDQMTWETTRIIVKANYTPNGFQAGDNFYRIKNDPKNYDLTNLGNAIKRQIVVKFNQQGEVDFGAAATTAGVYSLSDLAIKINGTAATEAQLDQIAQGLGMLSGTEKGFSTFKGGVSYYQARIKHFGDLTPWQLGDPTYGGDNAKYLGRYGMVRNNSYEININSITGPGSAIVPPIEPGPDDESKYFMSISVNVLSWAKRVQDVDL